MNRPHANRHVTAQRVSRKTVHGLAGAEGELREIRGEATLVLINQEYFNAINVPPEELRATCGAVIA